MENLSVNPKLILFILFIPIFLISISIHEFAHAFVASKLGDNTAKNIGRLTLNPLKHLDAVGSILIPIASFSSGIALIGWAKPVPINPENFQNRRFGDGVVSFVGPFSNFVFALFLLFLMIILPDIKLLELNGREFLLSSLIKYGIYINVFLFLFNLLPIPPLDGAHILHAIINSSFTQKLINLGWIGSIILLLFIYSPLWRYFNYLLNSILKIMIEPLN